MGLFKKSKDKKIAEQVYDLLSNKTKNYTLEEIKQLLENQKLSKKVMNLVIRKIKKNKLPLKSTTQSKQLNAEQNKQKEDILKDLSVLVKQTTPSKDVTIVPKKDEKAKETKQEKIEENLKIKKDTSQKDSKKAKEETKTKKEIKKQEKLKNKENKKSLKDVGKAGFFTKFINFFKRIYFFFEDNYYRFIDWISKAIPINKLTDKIDKVFPSFILFIILIAVLIYLFLTGTFSFVKSWTIIVDVTDPSHSYLSDVKIDFLIKDKIIDTQTTDIFGTAIFKNIKSKKQKITLFLEKEKYNSKEYEFKLNKNNLAHKITIDINTNHPITPGGEDEEKNIFFVEANDILVKSKLTVLLACTNTQKTPTPSSEIVSTGDLKVFVPKACGVLRVTVKSSDYVEIKNIALPENNKIVLTKKNQEKGSLSFEIKDILNQPLKESEIKIHNYINNIKVLENSALTDIYGLKEFSLTPKEYYATISKEGYLPLDSRGPFKVVKNENTHKKFILFTVEDLINFDCTKEKYKPFCIDNKINCKDENLLPYLFIYPDGTCKLGTPGYIDVRLEDKNSSLPVYADIVLESKLKDSDSNFSIQTIKHNASHHVFNVLDFYSFRVSVVNSEKTGYIAPDPILVTNIDTNVVFKLEYSSELNSGDINVLVLNNEEPIRAANVYLYREDVNGNYISINPETPKTTNSNGLVSFEKQLAGRKYYAYAHHKQLNLEGESSIKRLDANKTVSLEINLETIMKTLNLKVTPLVGYDIYFYDYEDEEITDYIKIQADQNTIYNFLDELNTPIYAKVYANGYASYTTGFIDLISGQTVYKQIDLTPLSSCPDVELKVLGLYNETGDLEINEIDFLDDWLNKEYKLKFKYTSCVQDLDVKKILIKSGNNVLIDEDHIYLLNEYIPTQEYDIEKGYMFSGEHIPDFNYALYTQRYTLDRTYSDYNGNGYKWLEIDFTDFDITNVIEFSVNFKFRNEDNLVHLDNYRIRYKAHNLNDNPLHFSSHPALPNSWVNIPQKNGYFYAKSNVYDIPFVYADHVLSILLKDVNNEPVYKYANNFYALEINEDYKYDLNYLYLSDYSKTGNLVQASEFTNNNLIYKSYGYVSNKGSSGEGGDIYTHVLINDINYSVYETNTDINKGYQLRTYSLLSPIGYFNFSNKVPKIVSDIFQTIQGDMKVLAYNSDSNFLINITTNQEDNKIFVGENLVSFEITDNLMASVKDVNVFFNVNEADRVYLGTTNDAGKLLNTSIGLDYDLMDYNINFYFVFPVSYSFANNEIKKSKKIHSGITLLDSEISSEISFIRVNNKIHALSENLQNYNFKVVKEIPDLKLQEIIFNDLNNNNAFNKTKIEANLKADNQLPLALSLGQKEIITNLVLNPSLKSSKNVKTQFRNKVSLFEHHKIFDVNNLVVLNYLGDINFDVGDINSSVDLPIGVKEIDENEYSVELIENLHPSVGFKYIFSTTKNAVLKIKPIGSIPNFLDQNVLSEVLDVNINLPKITDTNVILNFTLKSDFTGDIVSQDLNLEFTISFENATFVFYNFYDFTAFKQSKIINIQPMDNFNNLEMYCSENSCSSSKKYNFKTFLKNFNLHINKPVSLLNPDNNLSVNDFLESFLIPSTEQGIIKAPTFGSNFNNLQDDVTLGENSVVFKFSLFSNQTSIADNLNKALPISYKIIKGEQFIADIDLESCIGVGGDIKNDDIFILGCCEQKKEVCYTGIEYSPKIFYNWGEEVLPSSNSWSEICTSFDDDMNSKYACDSLQAMISILTKVTSQNVTEPFYIKLMNDGISKDFLKDFIDYIEDPSGVFYLPSSLKNINSEFFNEQAIDDDKFKVTINNNPLTKTFSPGIYRVMVYGDDQGNPYSNTSSDEFLHIDLFFVKNIPQKELSVFHYMPIDGGLKFNSEENLRKGYGIEIEEDSYELDITENLNLKDFPNVNDAVSKLQVINHNNINTIGSIINSEGKILELTKNDDFILMKYAASYPIPLYADITCTQDNNFSYNLLNKNYSLDSFIGNTFLKWKYEDKQFVDGLYNSELGNYYVLKDTTTVDNNSLSVRSMLYIPTNIDSIQNIKFKLSELNNNENTTLHTLNYLHGVSSDLEFDHTLHKLGSDLTFLKTLQGIFKYIEQGKACIYKSATDTYIKWDDAAVNFNSDEIDIILNNISQKEYNCLDKEPSQNIIK